MDLLIDTNILLDILLDRKEFTKDSLMIWRLCETKRVKGYVSALSIPNVVYIMRKSLDSNKILSILKSINLIFNISELTSNDLIHASELKWNDYEDAIHEVVAERLKVDYIITRNKKDYNNGKIPVLSPTDFLNTF